MQTFNVCMNNYYYCQIRVIERHVMVFCVFIFNLSFRNNVIREQLDENDFRRCHGFFSKVPFGKYPGTWKLRGTLTTAFERHLTTEYFTDVGVKPVPRHLTYYCKLLFVSDKLGF